MISLLKKPSAWVPIIMSFGILFVMLVLFLKSGPPVHEADEGIGAHLFQIWLILETLMIPFFGIKWLAEKPKETLFILAIQIFLVIAGCFPVFYFKL